jgi:broad specificity phosphatase PhoE
MRHGQAFRPGMGAEMQVQGSSLTTKGLSGALAVGRRFADALAGNQIGPDEVTVACAPSPEARATAAALIGQLPDARPAVPLDVLDPADWAPGSVDDARARWEKVEARIRDELGEVTRAVVLVGHDPQASWLLHDLVERGGRGQRGAGPLPLARGELAMLAAPQGDPLALQWVLSPSDREAIEQLEHKSSPRWSRQSCWAHS